jgi:hypothetical protein
MGILYVLAMLPFEDRLRCGAILELNQDLNAWSKDGSLPLQQTCDIFGHSVESDIGK